MNIVVLCGGTSTEREISLISSEGICKALRSRGHRAVLIDVFLGYEHLDITSVFKNDYDMECYKCNYGVKFSNNVKEWLLI